MIISSVVRRRMARILARGAVGLSFLFVLPLRAAGQGQPYYTQNSDGSVSPQKEGDRSALHVKYWRALLYRRGQPAGGKNKPWGSFSGDTPEQVVTELTRLQVAEPRNCAEVHHASAPCSDYTYLNAIAPVAVLEDRGGGAQNGVDEVSFPGPKETPRAVLSRLVVHWGNQLDKLRKKLARMEPRGGSSSQNPYSGVGSVVREYKNLLADAERQYQGIRQLNERVSHGFDVRMQDIDVYRSAYERDAQRLESIGAPSAP